MTKQAVELGDEAQDAVTGFKGIVVAETRWLYGCNRYTLQPAVGKDGKVPESATFDEPAVTLVKAKARAKDERVFKTGGPKDDRAALRRS